jgi:hypothetical protein
MVDIKVAILEKDGEEFDDPVEYDSETLVRNILGGVISDYMPRRTTLKLVDTSSNSQGWLRLSDQGISSDRVGYIPPYDCYVKSITFTNRNDENSTLLSEEITRMAISGEINPNDPVAVGTFVRTKLDPFVDGVQHILCDLKTYYYWRLDDLFQAIPREPLLASDERLEFYRDEIKRIVGHI